MGKEELGAKSKTNLNLPLKADREWRSVRLRHVVKMNPSKSEIKNLSPELFVSFLPMDNIGDDGSLRLDTTKSISEVITGYTYFQNGDVTVAKITPCFENGKGALMQDLENGIGFGTTELIVVRPNSDFIEARFLQWLFRSAHFRKMGEAAMFGAGGQKRVPDDFVRNFLVVLPSLPEQQAIAAFLDAETSKIDALVAEQRRLIELLKEKRQAVISHAVTKGLNPHVKMKPSGIDWLGDVPEHWRRRKLKHVISYRKGVAFKAEAFKEAGIPVVKASDIKDLTIREPSVFLADSYCKEFPRSVLRAGEIVLSTVGSTPDVRNSAVGQVGRIPLNLDGALLNQNTVVFVPNESEVVDDYLFFLLQTSEYRDHLDIHAHGTANQASLNVSDMLNFEFCLPSLSEQVQLSNHIAFRISQLLKLGSDAERTIALLQERRTALISAAVTGKIDVRDFVPKDVFA
jgi:type I restriction enzyme S subunit